MIDCNDGSDENICLEIPPTDLVEKFMCQDGAKIYVDKGGLFSEIIMVFVLLSTNYSLFFLKFGLSEKHTSSWFGRLLSECTKHEEDCTNFCGLLRKAYFYNPQQRVCN